MREGREDMEPRTRMSVCHKHTTHVAMGTINSHTQTNSPHLEDSQDSECTVLLYCTAYTLQYCITRMHTVFILYKISMYSLQYLDVLYCIILEVSPLKRTGHDNGRDYNQRLRLQDMTMAEIITKD